jgi:hypothetical protein
MESATEEFNNFIHKGSFRGAESCRVCRLVICCVAMYCSCLSYNMFGQYNVILRYILYLAVALYFLFGLLCDDVPMRLWFFNFPSSRTMALGSTQPLTEMSTRNLSGGKGRPAREADNLTAICEPIV